jgi:DNA-directed RNA polymerase specialized sigma24 family protein
MTVRAERVGLMGDRRAWAGQVIAAVSALGTLEGEIVRLIYFYRLTQADTATRLDLPPSTVKSVLADAMYTLGSALEVKP